MTPVTTFPGGKRLLRTKVAEDTKKVVTNLNKKRMEKGKMGKGLA